MCIRDRVQIVQKIQHRALIRQGRGDEFQQGLGKIRGDVGAVSYTHLRAHETVLDLVCRLLLEKKKYACSYLLQRQ